MAVTETLKALGAWSLNLDGAPQELIDALAYYGHVAIHPGRINYPVAGDSALSSARYVGVLRSIGIDGSSVTVGGPGMAMWLGDEDKKGDVFETPLVISAQTFENAIRAALPASGAITEGTLFNIGQNFTGTFVFQSPREIIDYITDTLEADWKISGDGKLSAGLESDLFVTNPKTFVIRKEGGMDMAKRAFLGTMKTDQDVEDFTTRVVLLATGPAGPVQSADADINPGLNPYKDIHGNFVKMTRLISESSTDFGNAPARAQLQLNRFSSTRDAINLSTAEFDVRGDVAVGDYLFVHDPEMGLVDGNNEEIFRGKRYNPIKLRLIEMTWPVSEDFSAGYRDSVTGKWYDLTNYIIPENGSTTLVVGGYNRSLTGGADGGVGGAVPQPDTTVPGVPTWVTPFQMSIYQSIVTGETKGQVQLKWTRPNNIDSSTITDGDHYDIRWRNATTPLFQTRWGQLATFRWGALSGNRWGQPLTYTQGDWNYATAPWSELTFLLQELAPSMPYEAQIRAVDAANPPNAGAWSTLTSFQTNGDTIAPATPAPPTVAASLINVQIVHTLGRSDGGTYNLDLDLHHLEIHGGSEPNFTPSNSSLLGKVIANAGMITGHIPVVGSVPIEELVPVYFKVIAVDNSGNKSPASTAVQTTAELIDNAHISDLTVSKVTAGTISADWINAGNIKTGVTGSRIEMRSDGILAFNSANNRTFFVEASTGNTFLDGNIEMPGVVRVRDQFNAVQAELGLLADGSYGIALRNSSGTFLKLQDFVFGPQAADIPNFERCTSTSFTDLATYGPAVGVNISATGRAMVICSCGLVPNDSGAAAYFRMDGANTVNPQPGVYFRAEHTQFMGGAPFAVTCSFVTYLSGLNPGFTQFTMKYLTDLFGTGIDAYFQFRRISVLPY